MFSYLPSFPSNPVILALLLPILPLSLFLFYQFVFLPLYFNWRCRSHGIPTEPFRFVLGNLSEIRRYRQRGIQTRFTLDLLARHRSSFVLFFLGPFSRLVVTHPAHIQAVLKESGRRITKNPEATRLLTDLLGRDNLLLETDEIHKRHRKLINSAFLFDNLKGMLQYMLDSPIENFVDMWNWKLVQKANELDREKRQEKLGIKKAQAQGNQEEEEFPPEDADMDMDADGLDDNDVTLDFSSVSFECDAQSMFSDLTLAVVSNCLFRGVDAIPNAKSTISSALNRSFHLITYRVFSVIGFLPGLSALPIFKRTELLAEAARLQSIVLQLIEQRKAEKAKEQKEKDEDGEERPDLLDLLMRAGDSSTGEAFTPREIMSQAITFVLAGHETTSRLLCFFFVGLKQANPQEVQQLIDEIDEFTRQNPNPMEWTPSDLNSLKLLDCFIQETLRLYPPAPTIVRRARADLEIVGGEGVPKLFIPNGIGVVIPIFCVHRNPVDYPSPEEFQPRRWLKTEKNEWNQHSRHPFSFLPFSNGPYNCIGQNFAYLEAKLILIRLLSEFHIELKGRAEDIILELAVTLRAKNGVPVIVKKREKPAPSS